jgi:hypothetical protein
MNIADGRLPVTMQKISDDINKTRCLFFVVLQIKEGETELFQVINCEKRFRSGFPLRIHQLTTMFNVMPITMGLPCGSLMGLSMMNGRQQALSYGPAEIVWFSIVFPPPPLMISNFIAGSGKSGLWWVASQLSWVCVAYIGGQFFGHKGH